MQIDLFRYSWYTDDEISIYFHNLEREIYDWFGYGH